MKAPLRKIIILGIFIIVLSPLNLLFSQTDSMKLSYSQENADSSDYNYHRKYEYLDINLKDETKMFKIAIPTFSIYYNNNSKNSYSSEQLNLYFTYERKINPSWAFLIEDVNNGSHLSSATYLTFGTSLDWGIRYYLLMEDRIKKGISGNNCNGVYADFFLLNLNQFQFTHNVFEHGNVFKINDNFYDFSALLNKATTFDLNLGLQKRLNNFSFIDAKIYLEYTPDRKNYYRSVGYYADYVYKVETDYSTTFSHFNFGLSFKIGLGWGWK